MRSGRGSWGGFDSEFTSRFEGFSSGKDFGSVGETFGSMFSSVESMLTNGLKGVETARRGDDLEVTIDIPGVKAEDVKIVVKQSSVLEVTTVRKDVKNTHSVDAKVDIKAENVTAKIADGVLTIVVKDAYLAARKADEGFEVPVS